MNQDGFHFKRLIILADIIRQSGFEFHFENPSKSNTFLRLV